MTARTPWLTLSLCVAMAVGYALSAGVAAESPLALTPAAPAPWAWWTVILVHASPGHLASNLLLTGLFGWHCEQVCSRRSLATGLLVWTAGATLAQALTALLYAPDRAGVPVVGASGMAAGLIGLFGVRFRAESLALWRGGPRISCLSLVLLWICWNAVQAASSPGAHTGHAAHLSGLTLGALWGVALEGLSTGSARRTRVAVDQAMASGDWLLARRLAELLTQNQPERPASWLALARTNCGASLPEAAWPAYYTAITRLEAQNEHTALLDAIQEVMRSPAIVFAPTDVLHHLALTCWRLGDRAGATGLLERAVHTAHTPGQRMAIMGDLARLLLVQREAGPSARDLLQQARALGAMDPVWDDLESAITQANPSPDG